MIKFTFEPDDPYTANKVQVVKYMSDDLTIWEVNQAYAQFLAGIRYAEKNIEDTILTEQPTEK